MNTTEPRGIRNNNPGNIRLSAATAWEGQTFHQPDPEFVTFSSPEYGIRAIAKILLTYQREGFKTLGQIIHRWAPPSENDTDAYIQAVCNKCGVGEDMQVDVKAILPDLIKAIIKHENGEQPYSDAQINAGISMALGVQV